MKEDTENVEKEYLRLFGEMSYDEARIKIAGMRNDKNYENYTCFLCDSILDGYTRDYTYYRDRLNIWRNRRMNEIFKRVSIRKYEDRVHYIW